MEPRGSRLMSLIAFGTFLVLFGLLVVGAIIGISRLARSLWGWLG